MNIGIDIDGVLTDEKRWHIDLGSKIFGEIKEKSIKNHRGFSTREIFGVTKEEEIKFWEDNIWDYSQNEKPRTFVKEIIDKLKNEGNMIYIITAREYSYLENKLGNKMRETVKKWFEDNKIYYDEIFFTNQSKLDICLKKDIDIMIEDNKDNINEISTKIPVICMNETYNEECINEKIYRCYSWYDIYYTIKKIEKD